MSDSQLKCKYQSHHDEDIIAVCINNDCKHPRLCCFTCMQDGHHDQHRKEILKFQQFNQWKQDGIKIIDQIKLVISELENMTSVLKQLVIDNQKDIHLNIGYATATQIESSINQINKLKIIDQIVKNDLDQLIQQIKKKIKELKSQIGTYYIQFYRITINVIVTNQEINIIIRECYLILEKILFLPNIKIRFSQQESGKFVEVSDQGRRVEIDGWADAFIMKFCLCEPVLPKHVESTFAIKSSGGNVDIGICKRDIIRNANYQPKLNNIGHGSFFIGNDRLQFSHHQKEINFQMQSFQFSVNDIIIVNVDLSKYKITWMHQETKKTFSMELDQQGSDYYPCVCLGSGEAEIVDNF